MHINMHLRIHTDTNHHSYPTPANKHRSAHVHGNIHVHMQGIINGYKQLYEKNIHWTNTPQAVIKHVQFTPCDQSRVKQDNKLFYKQFRDEMLELMLGIRVQMTFCNMNEIMQLHCNTWATGCM